MGSTYGQGMGSTYGQGMGSTYGQGMGTYGGGMGGYQQQRGWGGQNSNYYDDDDWCCNQGWGRNRGGAWGGSGMGTCNSCGNGNMNKMGSCNSCGRWSQNRGSNSNSNCNQEPPCDIFDTGLEYVIEMDLPGFTRETVEMKLNGNEMCICTNPTSRSTTNFIMCERPYRQMTRKITLPQSCDLKRISATLTNGVLKVCIPKTMMTNTGMGMGGNTGMGMGNTGMSNSGMGVGTSTGSQTVNIGHGSSRDMTNNTSSTTSTTSTTGTTNL